MFRRFLALYRRYATSRMQYGLSGCQLVDADDATIGNIDHVEIGDGMVRVTGWAIGDRVTLRLADQSISGAPTLRRVDVFAATGHGPEVGFDLVLPCNYEGLMRSEAGVEVHRDRGAQALYRRVPSRLLPWRVRARTGAAFAGRLMVAAPLVRYWRRRHDPAIRARVKSALQLRPPSTARRLLDDHLVLDAHVPGIARDGAALVVMPIYDGFDLLEPALDRLLRHTPSEARLLLIDDCSPDARVAPLLREIARRVENEMPGRLTHATNPENLGFIGTVNAAFEIARRDHPDLPVVLLNSDAFVPEGWLPRLLEPLADETVASVTPMSNDAEIFTVPAICKPRPLAPGEIDRIDALARTLEGRAAPVAAPTGVGFCMALSPRWLREVAQFDAAFGRGYGEEVDWCQKVRAAGGRHVALPSLFVEHRGGASFGSEAKLLLVARNNAIVAGRYPRYDQEVQDFIRHDPLLTPRLILSLAVIDGDADAPVPVYLAHDMGGGAEGYLQGRIAGDLERRGSLVVIRVGGERRWQIEAISREGTTVGQTDRTDVLLALLAPIRARHVVYSCGVGDRDAIELPGILSALRSGPRDRVEMLFHDFYPLSPSYTLLDGEGRFHGMPAPEDDDPAHRTRRADGEAVSLAEWRAAWHALAAVADELRVFSADSGAHVATAWPDLADRIRVVPHIPAHLPDRMSPPDGPPVIGVLGNIGPQKGLRVLHALAGEIEAAGEDAACGLVVIGNVDPANPLPPQVPVTGTYTPATLSELARRHRVSHWLIPSIWPETFSFTTHEALATGLPVLGFDLGAQGAAIAAAPNGRVLPCPADRDAEARAAREIVASVLETRAPVPEIV